MDLMSSKEHTMGAYSSICPRKSRSVADFFVGGSMATAGTAAGCSSSCCWRCCCCCSCSPSTASSSTSSVPPMVMSECDCGPPLAICWVLLFASSALAPAAGVWWVWSLLLLLALVLSPCTWLSAGRTTLALAFAAPASEPFWSASLFVWAVCFACIAAAFRAVYFFVWRCSPSRGRLAPSSAK